MLTTNLSPSDRAALSLSFEDYVRFARLVKERFGLAFPDRRRTELEIGVRRAFAESTAANLDSYYQSLLDPLDGALELERLVNNLTIGETHFFRDAGQFDALANRVLPEIIERRRATRILRIWSAGCASGEEPYSIAMLLREMIPDLPAWNITILGTDINTRHLERARQGVYGEWAFREPRARVFRARCFREENQGYRLDPELCKMVTFRALNLAEEGYPSYETNTMFMDLILCRNVTIYFPEEVTARVISRFYNALVDGGWLVVGHSEYAHNHYQRFHLHSFPDAILYQRTGEPQKPVPSVPNTAAAPGSFSDRQPGIAAAPVSAGDGTFPGAWSGALNGFPPYAVRFAGAGTGPLAANAFELAQSMLSIGHVDRARDLLLRWLEAHPNHAPGCALLGKAFADLGNWPEAERWCQIALSLDPLNLEGYYILALVFQHQGKAEWAIETMKKVIYIHHDDALGHFSLANLFHQAGQRGMALKYLENARRILDKLPPDALVPRSGEVSAARLMQTVVRQQQTWTNEEGGNIS